MINESDIDSINDIIEVKSQPSTYEEDPVQQFISDNLDTILDIHDDIKERYAYNPYFLEYMTPTSLVEFIIDNLRPSNSSPASSSVYVKFETCYHTEIRFTFHLISCVYPDIELEVWKRFCFEHSNLKEL